LATDKNGIFTLHYLCFVFISQDTDEALTADFRAHLGLLDVSNTLSTG